MFNKIFGFSQHLCEKLYNNSLILQNLDSLILISILAVFISSTFAQSETIGIFAIIATLLTFVKLLVKPDEKLTCCKFEYFLLVYFMLVIVSLAGSSLFYLSLKGFFKILIYLGFYVSLVQYLKNNKDKTLWIIFTIAGCVAFETVNGLLQTVIRPEAISTWQDTSYLNPEDIINRVYGTLKPYNPNLFGGYLVATIPSLLALVAFSFYKNSYKLTLTMGIILLLSAYVLLQTGCRGAYLGIFAIFVTFTILCGKLVWHKYKQLFLTIIGSLTALGTLFILSISSLRSRIFSIFLMRADSSNSFRFNVYNSCLEMLKDNWLLGIGLGNQNFRETYGLYMKTGFDALSAYNIYLEIAVESGIFALICFVIFLALAIYQAYRFITTTQNKTALILNGVALLTIIGLMVHGLVDTVFFRPQIHFIFWTMIAIIKIYDETENV